MLEPLQPSAPFLCFQLSVVAACGLFPGLFLEAIALLLSALAISTLDQVIQFGVDLFALDEKLPVQACTYRPLYQLSSISSLASLGAGRGQAAEQHTARPRPPQSAPRPQAHTAVR